LAGMPSVCEFAEVLDSVMTMECRCYEKIRETFMVGLPGWGMGFVLRRRCFWRAG